VLVSWNVGFVPTVAGRRTIQYVTLLFWLMDLRKK